MQRKAKKEGGKEAPDGRGREGPTDRGGGKKPYSLREGQWREGRREERACPGAERGRGRRGEAAQCNNSGGDSIILARLIFSCKR